MTEIKLTSEITVEEIDHCGSDDLIAHAAMVSTRGMLSQTSTTGDKLTDGKIVGLIKSLMRMRHGTPFEQGTLIVRVHAPIKVWREWHRHRVGWSYNEESGRYKQLDPVFYVPPRNRPMIRPEGFKSMRPAFDTATDAEYSVVIHSLKAGYEESYREYEHMLRVQVDRGLARDVLGVGIYSACYCKANPRSIMHFLELRTTEPLAKRPSAPLYEIEVAARKLEAIFKRIWPVTYDAWVNNGRQTP